MPDDRTRRFYDELAADYHLIFADWDASMARQGRALDRQITARLGPDRRTVLDCACGIGTQSLALAALGHEVIGTDLSPVASRRATTEGRRRGLTLRAVAADMRYLPFPDTSFDVVVCADNAIAHLLTPHDLRRALQEMRRVLRPSGLLVLSVRSDVARENHPVASPVQRSVTPDGPVITLQLWDWHADGERYDLQHIQLHPAGDSYTVRVRRATSWALTRAQLDGYLRDAGWEFVEWQAPEDSGFFQPLVVAQPRPGRHERGRM